MECRKKIQYARYLRVCNCCNKEFNLSPSSIKNKASLFCSKNCSDNSQKRRVTRICSVCKCEFDVTESKAKQAACIYCSKSCEAIGKLGVGSPQYKGGSMASNGSIKVSKGNHEILAHRIIVESIIGRRLDASEVIIHLNGKNDDNRPENLFICPTVGTMVKYHKDCLPWPKESNLSTYK